jgi:hypothetical protein
MEQRQFVVLIGSVASWPVAVPARGFEQVCAK